MNSSSRLDRRRRRRRRSSACDDEDDDFFDVVVNIFWSSFLLINECEGRHIILFWGKPRSSH